MRAWVGKGPNAVGFLNMPGRIVARYLVSDAVRHAPPSSFFTSSRASRFVFLLLMQALVFWSDARQCILVRCHFFAYAAELSWYNSPSCGGEKFEFGELCFKGKYFSLNF